MVEDLREFRNESKAAGDTHLPTIIIHGPPDDEDLRIISFQPTKPAEVCCICLTETNILHLVKVPPDAVMNGIRPFLSSCGIMIEKEEIINNEQLFQLSLVGVQQWFESSGLTLKILHQLFISMNKIGWELIPQEEVELHECLKETTNDVSDEMSLLADKLVEQNFIALYFMKHYEPDLNYPSDAKFFGMIIPHSATLERSRADSYKNLGMQVLNIMKSNGMEMYYEMEFVIAEDPAEEFKNFGIWIFKYNRI